MSENNESLTPANGKGDTVIGEGMRLDGNIECGGNLLVRGAISGNVACAAGHSGNLVIDPSGSITGVVTAPHIVLKGRIDGPMHSSQLIEIRTEGCCNGDLHYHQLDIQAGAKISGKLAPSQNSPVPPPETTGQQEASPAQSTRPPAVTKPSVGPGRIARRMVLTGLIVATGIGIYWRSRPPATDNTTPDQAPTLAPGSPIAVSPPSQPAQPPKIETAPPATPTPPPAAVASAPTAKEAPPQNDLERPEPDARKIMAIPGANPAKSAGVLYLIVKEPAVFYKKKRDDATLGSRIDVTQQKTLTVPIGRNELFRVARGSAVEIFYQGKKVSQRSIDQGEWMSFTPVTTEQ